MSRLISGSLLSELGSVAGKVESALSVLLNSCILHRITSLCGWPAGPATAGIRILRRATEHRPSESCVTVGVAEIVVVRVVVDAVPFLKLPGDILASQVQELVFSVWLQWGRRLPGEVSLQQCVITWLKGSSKVQTMVFCATIGARLVKVMSHQ